MKTLDKFYSVEEVAKLLRVSEKTIRRWLTTGIIQGFKIGDTIRIKESDLQNAMQKI